MIQAQLGVGKDIALPTRLPPLDEFTLPLRQYHEMWRGSMTVFVVGQACQYTLD